MTSSNNYTAKELAKILKKKRDYYPISEEFEKKYLPGNTWWSSQKEHIIAWLNELDEPGAYHRKTRNLDAKHFWNHFACAPGLLWVAEALGEERTTIQTAATAAAKAKRGGPQCAVIRHIIPWNRIAYLIECDKKHSSIHRVFWLDREHHHS